MEGLEAVAQEVMQPSGQQEQTAPPAEATKPAPTPAPTFEEQLKAQLGVTGEIDPKTLLTAAVQGIAGYEQAQAQLQQMQAQLQSLQQPKQEAPKSFWESRPEWNPEWGAQVVPDGQGGYKPAPGADPQVAEKAKAYSRYAQQVMQKFVADPRGTILELAGPAVEEKAKQIAEAMLAEKESAAGIQGFVNENYAWMVEKDGDQFRYDAFGRPVFTAQGQQFFQLRKYLESVGVKDWRAQAALAATMAKGSAAPAPSVGQQVRQASQGRAPAGAEAVPDFDRPAKPLREKLKEFDIRDNETADDFFRRMGA